MRRRALIKVAILLSLILPTMIFLGSLPIRAQATDLTSEKQALEIAKLQQEIKSARFGTILQQITVSIALITVAISAITAVFTINQQRKSTQNQLSLGRASQISELLKRLGETNQSVRSSAVFGLAQYDGTKQHILSLCLSETNLDVIDAIGEVLTGEPLDSLALAAASLRTLAERRLWLAAELRTEGVSTDEIALVLDIGKRRFSKLFNSRDGARSIRIAQTYRARTEILKKIAHRRGG